MLPRGLTSSSVVSHVLEERNHLLVGSQHVFYLEKYADDPLLLYDDFEYRRKHHTNWITALCTHEGEFIPHPEAIFPVTMSYATIDTIPIRYGEVLIIHVSAHNH